MKRYCMKFATLLTGICVAFGSCTSDLPDTAETNRKVVMEMGLRSYVPFGDTDSPVAIAESAVTSAYVYIFNANGTLENKGQTKVVPSGGSPIVGGQMNKTWSVYEGQKDIYVMLNPGTITTAAGVAINLDTYNPTNKVALEAVLTAADKFADDFKPAHANGMLMTGKALAQSVTAASSSVTVDVARRYSRVAVSVCKEDRLNDYVVEIQKISLKNHSVQTKLWGDADAWAGSQTAAVAQSLAMSVTVDRNLGDGTYTATDFVRYMMPRPKSASATDVPFVEIEATVDGTAKTYKAYFAEADVNESNNPAKPIAIVANKRYNMNITILKGEFDAKLNIEDWTDFTLDAPINGATIVASDLVLSDQEQVRKISFVAKPRPASGTVIVDWSGMPTSSTIERFGTAAGVNKTTVGVDADGKGEIEVKWGLPDPTTAATFAGQLVISNGTTSKAVGVMYGVYIPDPDFRAFLIDKGFISYMKNDYGLCKIISNGTANGGKIDLTTGQYLNAADLTGIEYFPEITNLQIKGSKVAYMDITKNTKLEIINCSNTKLTSLDVTQQPVLWSLTCESIALGTNGLDVTQNPKLSLLYCLSCKLPSLDVSQNALLEKLNCNNNLLTALDLSSNPALDDLKCNNNQISALDFTNNTKLRIVDCSYNVINGVLDFTPCQATIANINCNTNSGPNPIGLWTGVSGVTLGQAKKLTFLECSQNNLLTLDLTYCTALATLILWNNPISSLTNQQNAPLVSVSFQDTPNMNKSDIIAALTGSRSYDLSFSNNSNFTDAEFDKLLARIEAINGQLKGLKIANCENLGNTKPERIINTLLIPSGANWQISGNKIKKLTFDGTPPQDFRLTVGSPSLESLKIGSTDLVSGNTLTLNSSSNITKFTLQNKDASENMQNKITRIKVVNNPVVTSVILNYMTLNGIEVDNNVLLTEFKAGACRGTVTGKITNNPLLNTSVMSAIFTVTSSVNYSALTVSNNKQ